MNDPLDAELPGLVRGFITERLRSRYNDYKIECFILTGLLNLRLSNKPQHKENYSSLPRQVCCLHSHWKLSSMPGRNIGILASQTSEHHVAPDSPSPGWHKINAPSWEELQIWEFLSSWKCQGVSWVNSVVKMASTADIMLAEKAQGMIYPGQHWTNDL